MQHGATLTVTLQSCQQIATLGFAELDLTLLDGTHVGDLEDKHALILEEKKVEAAALAKQAAKTAGWRPAGAVPDCSDCGDYFGSVATGGYCSGCAQKRGFPAPSIPEVDHRRRFDHRGATTEESQDPDFERRYLQAWNRYLEGDHRETIIDDD